MKKIITLLAIAAMAAFIMISCSGNGSSKCPFGSLPEKCAQFQQEKEKLNKEAENIKTEAEKAELMKKWNKMQENWKPKIEESAKALEGKALALESELEITEPMSFLFEGFFSDNELAALKFKLNGSANAATDMETQERYNFPAKVYLVGYDAEGKQVYDIQVGKMETKESDGKSCIPAGTLVEFHSFKVDLSDQKYKDAQNLKLEVR